MRLLRTNARKFSGQVRAAQGSEGEAERIQSAIAQKLSAFRTSMDQAIAFDRKQQEKPVFSHPHDPKERRLNIDGFDLFTSLRETVGPEQVSPHYESFSMSRQVAITFWLGFFALSYMAKVTEIGYAARSLYTSWLLYFGVGYFFWEGRKFIGLPFQNDWYLRILENELRIFEANAAENMTNNSRQCVEEALEQLEFTDLHKNFPWVKKEAVALFVEGEKGKLKQHIKERAVALLKAAESMEVSNRKNLMSKILQESLDRLDKAQKNPSKEILDSTFKAGLEAIKTDKMTYSNDMLLKHLIEGVREQSKKFNALTEKEFA